MTQMHLRFVKKHLLTILLNTVKRAIEVGPRLPRPKQQKYIGCTQLQLMQSMNDIKSEHVLKTSLLAFQTKKKESSKLLALISIA